jgi:hypothetical protein
MEDKAWLQKAADGAHKEMPDGHAFLLFSISPGEGGTLRYISNIDRATAIKCMKEWLFAQGVNENWMKHVK